MLPLRRTFPTDAAFDEAWNGPSILPCAERGTFSEIAHFVAGGLAQEGFCLFANGGLPLIERRRGPLWEEIVFVPSKDEAEFTVRFHLSHEGVGEVRGRYWRPASRAPKVVAAGDVAVMEPLPIRALWATAGHVRTAEAVLRTLADHVLPWFDLFDDPGLLRVRLGESSVPLVDPSTAVELILAEYGEREARRFVRERSPVGRALAPEKGGYDLASDRLATIAAYYRL